MVPTASRRWHERMAYRLPGETGFICRQSLARALQGWWQHGSLHGRDISPQCLSRGAGLAVCGCTQMMWKRQACQVETLMLIACWSCHHQRASMWHACGSLWICTDATAEPSMPGMQPMRPPAPLGPRAAP